ncbi:YqgE/AlgH family protein [Roseivivax sp. CAU 1753]
MPTDTPKASRADPGSTDLTGRMLIAMPGMGDPRFDHAVIFLCSHSEDGAMGLILNKAAPGLSISGLLQQLDIAQEGSLPFEPVFFGGPVETGRGFVLHSAEFHSDVATLKVDDDFAMTATLDILEEIAAGDGPVRRRMCLGYSGWGPGQLEHELQQNGWLVCDADTDLVFETKEGNMWEQALARLGVSALMLSAEGGQA